MTPSMVVQIVAALINKGMDIDLAVVKAIEVVKKIEEATMNQTEDSVMVKKIEDAFKMQGTLTLTRLASFVGTYANDRKMLETFMQLRKEGKIVDAGNSRFAWNSV